jgi:hypothetical protein
VRSLVLADLVQQAVGIGIAGRSSVEILDLAVLGRLPGREKAVDGGELGLQPQPRREANGRRIGDLDSELRHPFLQAAAMAGLRLCHPPQYGRLTLRHALGNQLVDRAGLDLAAPGLEEALSHFGAGGRVTHALMIPDWGADCRSRLGAASFDGRANDRVPWRPYCRGHAPGRGTGGSACAAACGLDAVGSSS